MEKPPFPGEEDANDTDRTHLIHRYTGGKTGRLLPGVRRCSVPPGAALPALRRALAVTLAEISRDYEASAKLLRARLRLLRQQLAQATDPEEIWHLKRRIAELTPMLTQMNELAELTAHYYERGYWRNAKYTL